MECEPDCCNLTDAALGLFDPRRPEARPIALDGSDFVCAGEAADPCCKVDAVCSEVIATGRYESSPMEAEENEVHLRDVSICVLPAR